jgi:hypothetical protein
MIRRRLREGYCILRLSGSMIMLLSPLKKKRRNLASDAAGIFSPPSYLFLIDMLFLLQLLIHFSITISNLNHMSKKMAQEPSLLNQATENRTGRK